MNALEPSLCNNDSSDELFRQLSESNFEIESLLSDLATVEVKVSENAGELNYHRTFLIQFRLTCRKRITISAMLPVMDVAQMIHLRHWSMEPAWVLALVQGSLEAVAAGAASHPQHHHI